jgi:hypothetical protein
MFMAQNVGFTSTAFLENARCFGGVRIKPSVMTRSQSEKRFARH